MHCITENHSDIVLTPSRSKFSHSIVLPITISVQFCTDMKTTNVFCILTVCICVVAVAASKPYGKKDDKIVVNQLCNPAGIGTEINSLKKEVEKMRKELTQRLDKNENKGKDCTLFDVADIPTSSIPVERATSSELPIGIPNFETLIIIRIDFSS